LARGAERIDMAQIAPMSAENPQPAAMDSKSMLLCLSQGSPDLTDEEVLSDWKQHLLQLYIR
jgi:hypothetical protein